MCKTEIETSLALPMNTIMGIISIIVITAIRGMIGITAIIGIIAIRGSIDIDHTRFYRTPKEPKLRRPLPQGRIAVPLPRRRRPQASSSRVGLSVPKTSLLTNFQPPHPL